MKTIYSQWSVEGKECPWNTTFGTWEAEDTDIVVRSVSRLECVLPGAGAKRVRVILEKLQAPQRVGVELDDNFFHFGAGSSPGWKIELVTRILSSTTRESIGANTTEWCEADGKMLRMGRDEIAVLETPNPHGRLPVRALALHFPEGTRFRSLRVEAESFASASAPKPNRSGLKMAACIDFFDDLIANPWTTETFRECMSIHRKNHVRRIDFIYHFGRAGGWWRNAGLLGNAARHRENISQTFRNVGDFLPAAIAAAKGEGLEIFAVLKPFETAMFRSLPAAPPDGSPAIRSLGGWNPWTTDFAAQNPQLRMERNPRDLPADLSERRIEKIVLHSEGKPRGPLNWENLLFWESEDNGIFRQRQLSRSQVVQDPEDSRKVTLGPLNLEGRFFALSWGGESALQFGHRLDALVEIYDEAGRRLPLALSTLPNQPGRDFSRTGFVWDADGSAGDLFWIDGDRPLGIAIGVERYLQGALCPAYPEVQSWWLDQIQQCLTAGVDGIDIRVSNHSRTFHPESYGFNPPVVEAFKTRYGIDMRSQEFERRDLRVLLGEFYCDFLRQARTMVKEAGKSFHLHLELGFQEPEFHPDLEIYFDWRRWLDEGLADGVGIKNVRCMESPLAQEFAARARAAGVAQVDFNPSLNILNGHPAPDAFMRYVLDDAMAGGADGLVLYENKAFMEARPDGSLELTKPGLLDMARKAALA